MASKIAEAHRLNKSPEPALICASLVREAIARGPHRILPFSALILILIVLLSGSTDNLTVTLTFFSDGFSFEGPSLEYVPGPESSARRARVRAASSAKVERKAQAQKAELDAKKRARESSELDSDSSEEPKTKKAKGTSVLSFFLEFPVKVAHGPRSRHRPAPATERDRSPRPAERAAAAAAQDRQISGKDRAADAAAADFSAARHPHQRVEEDARADAARSSASRRRARAACDPKRPPDEVEVLRLLPRAGP